MSLVQQNAQQTSVATMNNEECHDNNLSFLAIMYS